MAIKIKIKGESSIDTPSVLFGGVTVEEDWLKRESFSPTDVFLCRVDLSEIKDFPEKKMLGDKGYLYFFVDIEKNPADCKVLFSVDPDAFVEFNYDSDCGYDVENGYAIGFSAGDKGTAMFLKDEKVLNDEICLLRYDTSEFKETDFLGDLNGALYFVIAEEELKRGDLSKTKLYFVDKK